MIFFVVIEPRALIEMQHTIDYYDNKLLGLGKKFHEALDKHFASIAKNPFYQIRYKDYRALPVRKFPFIILYYLDEDTKTAYVTAVFNTSQSPTKLPK